MKAIKYIALFTIFMLASCASSRFIERIDDKVEDIEKKYDYKGKSYNALIIGADSYIKIVIDNDSENTLTKSDVLPLQRGAYQLAKPYCNTKLTLINTQNALNNKKLNAIIYSFSCPLPADYAKSR